MTDRRAADRLRARRPTMRSDLRRRWRWWVASLAFCLLVTARGPSAEPSQFITNGDLALLAVGGTLAVTLAPAGLTYATGNALTARGAHGSFSATYWGGVAGGLSGLAAYALAMDSRTRPAGLGFAGALGILAGNAGGYQLSRKHSGAHGKFLPTWGGGLAGAALGFAAVAGEGPGGRSGGAESLWRGVGMLAGGLLGGAAGYYVSRPPPPALSGRRSARMPIQIPGALRFTTAW